MRKLVCARCGLVNLESFPSFPKCEGCGARLPKRKRPSLLGWVRRPVKTLVWAFSVGAGVATLTLLSVEIARETYLPNRGALLVASSIVAEERGTLLWSLRISPFDAADRKPMQGVRLRVDKIAAREADVQVVSPRPSAVEGMGNGRYFVWNEFAPRQTIRLRLRPRHSLKVGLLATGFERCEVRLLAK